MSIRFLREGVGCVGGDELDAALAQPFLADDSIDRLFGEKSRRADDNGAYMVQINSYQKRRYIGER